MLAEIVVEIKGVFNGKLIQGSAELSHLSALTFVTTFGHWKPMLTKWERKRMWIPFLVFGGWYVVMALIGKSEEANRIAPFIAMPLVVLYALLWLVSCVQGVS